MICPNCHFDLTQSAYHAVKPRGGKAPYGFVKVDGELTFDEDTGPTLARMMRWNTFEGTRWIASHLNAQSIPGPSSGEWSYGSVARVIKRGKELSHLIPLEYLL